MVKDALQLIKATILDMTDCDSMPEAISYFEGIRKQEITERSRDLFDELSKSQIAVLFKLLIDLGEVGFKNNIMFVKEVVRE